MVTTMNLSAKTNLWDNDKIKTLDWKPNPNLIHKSTVVDLNNGAQDVYVLISKTREYIILHVKRNFANVIKVMEFEMGILSWMIP